MKKIVILAFVGMIISSCGGAKNTTSTTSQKKPVNKTISKKIKVKEANTEDQNLDFATLRYIAKYGNIAKKEMKEYGVPASITLAQGVLESQSGKSRLAVEANNHFGIKCKDEWQGQMILHDDDKNQECFRKYDDPEKSYNDHSRFLTQRKHYAFLFRLPITDYEAWARGLKKAGYATDPSYPDKLIYIINKYNLDKMDKEVLQQMSVKVDNTTTTNENKKKKFIYEVKDGETLFTISKKFNVPVKDIQRINNLNDFDIYQGQILVLTESNGQEEAQDNNEEPENKDQNEQNDIQTKEEIVEIQTNKPIETKIRTEELNLHVVKQGETLFSISKKYHVSIETLKQLNNINSNSIAVGSVIKVPKTKQQIKVKPKKTNKSSTKTSNAVYHIVKPGETLYRIHVNYKVSIKKLRQLNHLKGNNIKVGQKIRVK